MGASRQQQGDQAEGPPGPARRSPAPEGRGGQGVRTHLPRHPNRRSATPSSPSAASAINAAGSAPARMRVSSTTATPRKMYTPSPPAPMAAAEGGGAVARAGGPPPPRRDHAEPKRHFDLRGELPVGHANPPPRLPHGRVHAGYPLVGVADDGQERVQDERDDGGRRADA